MKKFLKKISAITALFLVAGLIASVINHFLLKAAVNQYKAEMKARGEPMELSEVIPPPVPKELDGTEIFRSAAKLIESDKSLLKTNSVSGMKMVAPGKALWRASQPDIRESDATNSWESLAAAARENRAVFDALQKTLERPRMDFKIHYELGFVDGFDFKSLNLVAIKKSANYLCTAGILDLRNGDLNSAVTNELTMLVIAHAAQNQRLVISELVRIAVVQIASGLNWEILQATNLNDGALSALQDAWGTLDFMRGNRNALTMERIVSAKDLAGWHESPDRLDKLIGGAKETRKMLGGEEAEDTFFERLNLRREKFLWRYWWSYSDELRALMGYDVLMQTARFAETNGAWQSGLDQQFRILDRLGFSKFNSEWDNMIAGKINFRGILSESIPSLGAAFKKEMAAETVRRVNITAIALKRFELAHGNYPTNLNLLVPKFISAVPRDPVDGQPLRYHSKTNGTFLLYSVGENGVDDGGNPALEKNVEGESFHWLNPHALDWVWPQPATTNEVQAYFAAQAKGR